VPSKTLIRSSHVQGEVWKAKDLGWKESGGLQVDFPKVMERLRSIRSDISRHDSFERFKSLGVDVFQGDGKFLDSNTIEVAGKKLKFKKAVIATGARAALPNVNGLVETGFLTNETVFNLTELPKRLAVIGGGPLGSELAQAFRRFGSEVTLLDHGPQFLHREDPDAAEILKKTFEKEGLKVVLNVEIERVGKTTNGKVLHYKSNGVPGFVHVDEILVGAGRAPNVEGLNLEGISVAFDARQGVKVDDQLRTTCPHIFAAGDVCSAFKFTHAADAMARIVLRNALFRGKAKVSGLLIPWCTYTDPEVAHVGLYERDAIEKGIALDTFFQPFSGVDRAIAEGDTEGFVKVHVKKGTDQILGATIVASHAGEMISEITTAMIGKVGLGKMANIIHPYPTQAEAIKKIADSYNRAKLTPFVKKMFAKWMAWSR
ncbi:MAG TPA: mercuric reductase, partial [bacterium]